jgi:outer membrane protein TolC
MDRVSMARYFLVLLFIVLILQSSWAAPNLLCAQERFTTLSQAVYATLKDNPGIQISKQSISNQKGVVQSSTGKFDWIFFSSLAAENKTQPVSEADQAEMASTIKDQNEQIAFLNNAGGSFALVNPFVDNEYNEKTIGISSGVSKQLQTGVILEPSVTVTDYDSDNTTGPASRANIQFKITVPMMRGLGRPVAAAETLAAQSTLKAVELNAYHDMCQAVYLTIVNFWNGLAAQASFALVKESFERAESLLENVNQMVTAGMLEPAFLNQAEAKLFTTRLDVSDGELSSYKARQNLALAMGETEPELLSPPYPQGEFPSVQLGEKSSLQPFHIYVRIAKEQRLDYLATLRAIDTEEILMVKAKNDLRPKLDVTFQLGYAGVSEQSSPGRYLDSTVNRITGANGYVQLRLELPVTNSAAKGQLVSRNAARQSARLTAQIASDQVVSEVMIAVETIRRLMDQYKMATESAERYKDAVSFERKKYDAGESTLNALIDIEDRYINARLSVIEIIRKYAISVTNLKFVTGSLLIKEADALHFYPETIMAGLSISKPVQRTGHETD